MCSVPKLQKNVSENIYNCNCGLSLSLFTVCWLAADEQGEDELLAAADQGEEPPLYNRLTMPEVVISLDAGDEFLKQRVMNLPQSQVEGTHNTEDGTYMYNIELTIEIRIPHLIRILICCAGLKRRLELFRSENEIDTTVLNYFDEFEIHPDHIGV